MFPATALPSSHDLKTRITYHSNLTLPTCMHPDICTSPPLLPSLPSPPHPFCPSQGFYSVHGEAALFIARDFYRTLAVVKYLGGPPPSSAPGSAAAAAGGGSSASKAATPGGASKAAGLASVTLNRTLFEGVLHALLLEGGQHTVEIWEGAGTNWTLEK